MAYQDQFIDRITRRRFHSHYMAHTLRDAIIEKKFHNLSSKCMRQLALRIAKSQFNVYDKVKQE